MQTVQLFKSADFGEIRTLVLNSEPMFCLADVCKALDISHVTDVKKRLKEDGVATAEVIDSIGRKQCATFINEPNLYKTIFQSRKPSAERFTDWVTSEVLPSIRKNGIYATENIINQILENPDLGIEMFTKLKEERAARAKAEQEVTILQNENDLLTQEALEWADRPLINALVRAYGYGIDDFSQGWRDFKKELLYRYGININARITNHLNNSNSKQKPKTLDMLDDSELQNAVTTAVALCRNECIDISGIIEQKLNRKEEIA
ncbi:transporter [Clostridium sp. AM43-3BH]|jgi:prophage antirepressor-like protein|uniref:BRO-N domain-containing protein n=1 Tax=unclassified Clostridium TaxID=2614128 RepID=UPI000E4C4AAC|nr:BRO family protein [Clostridium sp. AM43-3BH]RHO91228.1 transporter [Clostridium sp. AF37-7]RHS72071.1 transporter [Clostridium sp. AM43-3BH]